VTERAVMSVRTSLWEGFFWKRWLVAVALSTLPALASFALGHGLFGLVLFALGVLPWPSKVSIDARGVQLRWLFLREHCEPERLERIQLSPGGAHRARGRPRALVIERCGQRPWVVFASEQALNELSRAAYGAGFDVDQAGAESP